MSITHAMDRQAARETAQVVPLPPTDAGRWRRARAGAARWEITETLPGTFRVVTTGGGDYAVWYFPGAEGWACSCPDFTYRKRACKHILAVRSRPDLVDPATGIPNSCLEGTLAQPPEKGTLTQPQQEVIRHEEDTRMEPSNSFTPAAAARLAAPFDLADHRFKPGATNRDRTRALALPYVDSRLYQARLDGVDPAWQSRYDVITLADRLLVNCRLTVLGVTREDVGEALLATEQRGQSVPDENAYTSAVAQAFKRACAQFGLGRYLYQVPKCWAEYDSQKRRFTLEGLARLHRALAQNIDPIDVNGANQRRRAASVAARAPAKIGYIQKMLADLGYRTGEAQTQALGQAGFPPLERLTERQAQQLIARLEARLSEKAAIGTNGK